MPSLVPPPPPPLRRTDREPSSRSPRAAASAHVPLPAVIAALGRARPACTVYALASSDPLVQIHAGLYALQQAGHIGLKQRFSEDDLRRRLDCRSLDDSLRTYASKGVFVDIEGAGLVYFEVRDGGNYYPEIADQVLI